MKSLAIAALLASAAWAQPCTPPAAWDTSGNSLLKGAYNFRYVQYSVADQAGNLGHALALYGTVTFDGNGGYTIAGNMVDSNSIPQAATGQSMSGAYYISASGFGFLTNPASPCDAVWGLVSQSGIFAGSSTETQNQFNDLFIAAPASSSAKTLQGAYSIGYINFPDGYAGDIVTAGFQMAPAGAGRTVGANILMYEANSSTGIGVVEPVSYTLSDGPGAGKLAFPTYAQAISRAKQLYVSPDTNFVFGGDPQAFDLFLGVRTGTSASSTAGFPPGFAASGFNGLYYQAGIDEIVTGSAPTASLQTYYGAFNVNPATLSAHQRIVAPLGSPLQGPSLVPTMPASFPYQPFSYTYSDKYSLAFGSNLGYVDAATGKQYVFGANGNLRLGFGVFPNLGISIAFKAPAHPSTPPSPVYLYSDGVVNAGSYAPYTAGIAPGEQIVLSGSGLATTSGATQVSINSELAQVVTASPTQLSVVVPPDITGPYAQIQVTNGSQSNEVWALVSQTALGVLTQSASGLGDADAQDSSSNPVNLNHPAAAGKPLSIAVTGLGNTAASSGVSAIAGTTSSPPPVAVSIGGISAPLTSIAPAPGRPGVSLVTVTVPPGLTSADPVIAVFGPDSSTAQATVPVSK